MVNQILLFKYYRNGRGTVSIYGWKDSLGIWIAEQDTESREFDDEDNGVWGFEFVGSGIS
jgi:hypothetical protein